MKELERLLNRNPAVGVGAAIAGGFALAQLLILLPGLAARQAPPPAPAPAPAGPVARPPTGDVSASLDQLSQGAV